MGGTQPHHVRFWSTICRYSLSLFLAENSPKGFAGRHPWQSGSGLRFGSIIADALRLEVDVRGRNSSACREWFAPGSSD